MALDDIVFLSGDNGMLEVPLDTLHSPVDILSTRMTVNEIPSSIVIGTPSDMVFDMANCTELPVVSGEISFGFAG